VILWGNEAPIAYASTQRTDTLFGAKNVVLSRPRGDEPEEWVLRALAHESGHALYQPEAELPITGLSRDEWVKRTADSKSKDEGEANLVAFEIRDELTARGGVRLHVGTGQEAYLRARIPDPKAFDAEIAREERYEAIYKSYLSHRDRDRARLEMGLAYTQNEQSSVDPGRTYYDGYVELAQRRYDYLARQTKGKGKPRR
jgi:hypothetical protein